MKLVAIVAGTLVALLCVVAALGQAPAAPDVSRATGYAAILPAGSQGGVTATAGVAGERGATTTGLRPAGGGSVASIRVDVAAAAGAVEGAIAVSGLSLLQGRVTMESLRLRAVASADGGADGLSELEIGGLVVDGAPVAPGPGGRVEVAGIGTLVVGEHVVVAPGRVRVNALRLELGDPAAAALIRGPVVIGHLDLNAVAPAPPAPAPPRPAPAPETTPVPIPVPPAEPASATGPIVPVAPLGLPRRPVPDTVPAVTGSGYVFPVVGDAAFTDDYGAPRAGTGWHQGNDLFAPSGTPLVAVADGTLSRVGINTLGGNRLWLTDDRGNAFYYAHLSAYAPAAVEGARVSAGQVIGFLGNTGQAITTPPHLHFEIHPGDGDSVNPYPYLVAWRRGSDIPRAYAQAAVSTSPAPAAGAVLVDGVPEVDRPSTPADGLATPAT